MDGTQGRECELKPGKWSAYESARSSSAGFLRARHVAVGSSTISTPVVPAMSSRSLRSSPDLLAQKPKSTSVLRHRAAELRRDTGDLTKRRAFGASSTASPNRRRNAPPITPSKARSANVPALSTDKSTFTCRKPILPMRTSALSP